MSIERQQQLIQKQIEDIIAGIAQAKGQSRKLYYKANGENKARIRR